MLLDFQGLVNKYSIKTDGVIHIGAHHGNQTNLYQNAKIKNILYFEPLKKNFEILNEKFGLHNNIKLENMALGNFTGKVKMHVEEANLGQSSSILKPRGHIFQYPHIIFNKQEEVEITSLNEYNKKNDLSNFNIITIDVQGYELEVFKGASEILNNIDLIVSEVNRAELYENVTMVADLDIFLKQYGFKRVLTNWEGHTWGDAAYVKEAD